jgi:hypothetical protein
MDWTAIGTIITVLGGVWAIVSYKTTELEKRMEMMDERIFLLATGKTLREAMLEVQKTKEK